MIKLVYCIRKRTDLPAEEFRKYWLEQHGPLVRSVAAQINAAKYVQSHTVEPGLNGVLQQSRGLAEPYDGITEVWWEDVADLHAAMATAEGRAAMGRLVDDESKFIDFAHSRVFMTEEQVIFD
ncbi:EthD domain-containing protein [Oleomonas cavernae]|uniref:EthD domain-containing protein n=1 Tax=Oleomonas cavernae TaxID=2320859 RepID=UPI001314DA41|nr:EthD domain-containing protein [Oleomonas cavernae]